MAAIGAFNFKINYVKTFGNIDFRDLRDVDLVTHVCFVTSDPNIWQVKLDSPTYTLHLNWAPISFTDDPNKRIWVSREDIIVCTLG